MSYREKLDTRLAELVKYPEISEEEGQKLLEAAREYSQRHHAHIMAAQAMEQLESLASPLAVLSEINEQSQVLLSTTASSVKAVGDLLEEYITSFDGNARYYVPTPFPTLNEELGGGIHGGGVKMISAPPGAGKTDLVCLCAEYAAVLRIPTLYVSMEMSWEDLFDRGIARIGGVNSRYLRDKKGLSDEMKETIAKAVDKYAESYFDSLFFLEGDYDTTPSMIASQVAAIRKKKGLSKESPFFVVIDYIQLLNTGKEKVDTAPNETLKVSELAVMLKRLARDNNVAVLAISDITKEEQTKSTGKHGLSLNSLRGSNRLGHSADCVAFLYSEQSLSDEGKAEDDPWRIYTDNLKKGNERHPMIERLEKARKAYPLGGASATAYARIELGKNRWGRKGVQIPLLYHKAYHRMLEIQ